MKKFLALVLCMLLLVPSALASTEKIGEWYAPPRMTEGQYPVAEGTTLTYWVELNAGAAKYISNQGENPANIKLQEDTGITIQYIHPAAGMGKESFNMLIASGELPDMIEMPSANWYNGGLQALYDAGAIIDLAPYLDEYAPQYKEVLADNDVATRQVWNNGKVFGFYKMTYAQPLAHYINNTRQDWLEEAGMETLRTIEEYEAFFDWILANKEGVLPIYNSRSVLGLNLLMGCFDLINDWMLPKGEEGTVTYYAYTQNFKEYLALMNKWYEKGYISKDFMTLTDTEARAMFDSGKIAVKSDPGLDIVARNAANFPVIHVWPLRKTADYRLGSGMSNAPIGSTYGGDYVTVITSACKNVEAAIEYMNYGYTFEGSLVHNFGVEGELWNWGEDGIPEFTDLILNNPDGISITDGSFCLKNHFSSRYCYSDAIQHPGNNANTHNTNLRLEWTKDTDNYLQMPPVTLTVEEATERNELMGEIETYVEEMRLKFITGTESLDNYDAYLETLKSLGMERAIELTQAALDRFNGK